MQFGHLVKSLFLICMISVVSACGSGGGGTNGTLSMADLTATDLGGGNYSVQTTATYTPTAGKDPQGLQIDFLATFTTSSQSTTRSATVTLGSSGIASVGPFAVLQTTEPIIATIRASVGGLSVIKQLAVPAISPLSASPAAVAFTNAEGVGVTKTINIIGGFSPYTVTCDVPADINATAPVGSIVTLTKLVPVSASPVSATAHVIITDNQANQVSVPVGYFR